MHALAQGPLLLSLVDTVWPKLCSRQLRSISLYLGAAPFVVEISMASDPQSGNYEMSESQEVRTAMYKNGQGAPPGAILLGVLKSIESELTKRNLLGITADTATPLWFLAETERNVYLWRNGKSIDDHKQYSFWINIQALISKRREQLKRAKGFNPFINCLTSVTPKDPQAIAHERNYLDCIEELTETVFKHAEALSHASESVRLELIPEAHERLLVVLPIPASTTPG